MEEEEKKLQEKRTSRCSVTGAFTFENKITDPKMLQQNVENVMMDFRKKVGLTQLFNGTQQVWDKLLTN